MATFKLDSNQIEESYGMIEKSLNEKVIGYMGELAQVVNADKDNNELAGQVLENCKKMQAMYNDDFLASVKALLGEFRATFDIAEWLEKKAQIGDVASADVGFTTDHIDADSVIV